MALHHFQTALAKEFGIEEAILIDELRHQITGNRNNERNFRDGRYWTYNTVKAYEKTFSYMNASKIKRTINSLVEKGILMKGNYNTNQYDRTCWYAFTEFGESIIGKCYIEELKMTNGKVESGQPIPTTNTTTIPSISFTPSDESTADRLFDDDETSTMTMLSSEEIPYGPKPATPTAEEFEDLWLMYERKGSKAKAKKEFDKLTAEEIATMRCHIPAYLESRPEKQYRLDFERYIKNKTFNNVVYGKQNIVLYDPDASDTSATMASLPEITEENETITINGVTYR